MKRLMFIAMLITVFAFGYSQNNSICIKNNEIVDNSFKEVNQKIIFSINEDLFNLNLYEYSNALNELYSIIEKDSVFYNRWEAYIDSLLLQVKFEENDTIKPFYVSSYKGIIPLQAQVLKNSLECNTELKNNNPKVYSFLKQSIKKFDGKGYTIDQLDTLLTIKPVNSKIGTMNYWLFLQVYGCPVLELAIEKEGTDLINQIMSDLSITSTYKIPIELQKRKAKNLKLYIQPCLDKYNIEMKGDITKLDYDKNYYKKNLEEGFDMLKLKEF